MGTLGLEGWLWMAAWAGLLVLLVWLLLREPPHDDRDDALASLRARLGRGEISWQEFEQACRVLDVPRPSSRTHR